MKTSSINSAMAYTNSEFGISRKFQIYMVIAFIYLFFITNMFL
ncbi:hypothetical protein [Christiangramia oceanisediminis]|nr:hypothetical protein [Gramella oceanisediminis]